MYEELTRNMNEQERVLLRELTLSNSPVTLAETLKWLAVWVGGLLLCGLVATAWIMLEPHPIIGGIVGGPIAIAGIVCFYAIITLISGYSHWTRHYHHFVRSVIPEIKSALNDGQVFVKKITAEAVIEIIDFDNERPGYIYDVGNGKILFLKGQRFYPDNPDMSWPNSEFEIVRTVHGNMWIGIFCSGTELNPIQKYDSSEYIYEVAWNDYEDILIGNVEQFAMSIIKTAKSG